jgi:hypothetical protein
MEVHKHPHHVTHSKKWTEYLLEFLMIFFAVFLGFIAENIREESVEKHREKEYIESMINDLKTDTTKLGFIIEAYGKTSRYQDTLIHSVLDTETGFSKDFCRAYTGITSGFPDFVYTDATIQQLKNSGGFRLIRNPKIIEKIMAYDARVKKALINESYLGQNLERLQDRGDELFNLHAFQEQLKLKKTLDQMVEEKFDLLLTHDKVALLSFYNKLSSYGYVYKTVRNNLADVKKEATSLIHFLKEEYHLD